ncbi:FG-GAP repeat domain-containing protein [Metabacillus halosaccharovorans]|uniref:FG-GAP repeat domain-containing protein n=1 Tax=Metabacillus halosaccharovorans TaxID=930124 RepID=UPI001C1F87D0|nr:VCBS repeat-containing protein [Metabacillus halosaccharovorans]MBU7592825.1 VCBS repeat-containing protein [Metabacillus halosaccharovorans]
MRRKNKSTLITGLVMCSMMLSGCQLVESPNALIEAPQQEKKQNIELSKKAAELLPSNSELLTPVNSNKKQSIFIADINNDANQEAFLLYRGLGENRKVHLLSLQETENDWREVSDFELNYLQLDYFDLHDLDNDGQIEIVIGLGGSDFESKKELMIYQWKEEGLTQVANKDYEVLDMADYDRDGKSEVLIVHGKRREFMEAELLKFRSGQLVTTSSVNMDAYAFHENAMSGKLSDGIQALFIDGAVGAHSMVTEIIAFEDGKLIKVDERAGGMLIKEYPLYSKDINDDGIIEVGGMYIPKGWEEEAFADIPFIEYYSTYSINGEEKKIEERYTNRAHKFYITIPVDWHGKVTIEKFENSIQIVSVSEDELLFEVKWGNRESIAPKGHVYKKTKDTIFYTEMKEKDAFPFNQFHLLEDEF